MTSPVKIFFCYAREDETLLNKLKAHLKPLQRQKLIDFWHDRDISAGTEWEQAIKEQLNTAQIILLLVSPDFMDSEYCYSIEMKRALERREQGEVEVIPIILRHVYWQGEPLGKLQALPADGVPVTDSHWHTLDVAFSSVTLEIKKVAEMLLLVQSLREALSFFDADQFTEALESYDKALHLNPTSAEALWGKGETFRELGRYIEALEAYEQAVNFRGKAFVHERLAQEARLKANQLFADQFTLLRTLTGHSGGVWSVALSMDGRIVVSGSRDKTIKIWDMLTGKELRTLTGHSDVVDSVALSTDGQTLVSGSDDKTIKVWNIRTGKESGTLTGHSSEIWSLALTTDGQTLISGSRDKTIKIWDVQTKKEIKTLIGHSDSVVSVALSSDEQILVSGSRDMTIKIWDVQTGEELRTLMGHSDSVRCLALSADKLILISGSGDTVKVWNMQTWKKLRTLTGHSAAVKSLALSSDQQVLISGSYDKTIKIWDVQTGEELRTLAGHSNAIWSLALSADGQTLVSGSKDGTIKIWGTP